MQKYIKYYVSERKVICEVLVWKFNIGLDLFSSWSLIIKWRLAIENDQWRVWVGLPRIKILRRLHLADY